MPHRILSIVNGKKDKLKPRKRVAKKIVKESYNKIKHISPIGGDTQKNKEFYENEWVIYQ